MPSRQRRSEPLMGRDSYFEDQWDYFRADLRAKDHEGLTDMELVGLDDDGDFCSIKVHRAVVLPKLRSVVSPLHQDCPSLVFPDTSITVLQAIVALFYEGSIISSQQIIVEVLGTMKNLGIDPDRFTKAKKYLTTFQPREKLSNDQPATKKRKLKVSKEDDLQIKKRKRKVSKEDGCGDKDWEEEDEEEEKDLKIKKRKRKVSQDEEDGDKDWKEEKDEKTKKRKRKVRERSHNCQLCDFWCETVKIMAEHTELQHPGETLHCPFPGCLFQRENYMKLRIHQHNAQHFVTNHNKERNSQDVEKSVQLNNNEDDGVGTENNATAGEESFKPGQVDEDSDSKVETSEIRLSPDQPSDELDLKPQQDDEVKE